MPKLDDLRKMLECAGEILDALRQNPSIVDQPLCYLCDHVEDYYLHGEDSEIGEHPFEPPHDELYFAKKKLQEIDDLIARMQKEGGQS
jgi:hypothetical protein